MAEMEVNLEALSAEEELKAVRHPLIIDIRIVLMSDCVPEELEQITILSLQEKEIGYSVPWAVYVEESGLYWIRGDYPRFYSPQNEAAMRI